MTQNKTTNCNRKWRKTVTDWSIVKSFLSSVRRNSIVMKHMGIIHLTGESNKKKRAVENEIMNTTSLQVKDLSRFYHSTSIFFYRLNLTKQHPSHVASFLTAASQCPFCGRITRRCVAPRGKKQILRFQKISKDFKRF